MKRVGIVPILLALAPLYLVRLSLGGVPTTLFELAIYGIFLGAILPGSRSPLKIEKLKRVSVVWWIGLGLVLAGSLLGVALATDRTQALGIFKGFIFDPMLATILILGTLDHDDLPTMFGWYLGSAALVSLISIVAWALHAPWAVAADGRLLGIFGIEPNASPNYLAFWIAPAVAIGITWLITPPWPLKRWERLIPVATALAAIAVVGSASRAALGASLIAAFVALVLYYRSALAEIKYAQGLGWLLLIGLVAYGAAVVSPNFELSATTGGRITTSNNIRWEIWKTTGELMGQNNHWLIGVGLGSYQAAFGSLTANRVNYPEFITPRAAAPHNLWLNSWVNQGLLGLIGITLLIILAIGQLWKAEPAVGATLVSAWLISMLLQGLVDTPNWKNDTSVLFWVALACASIAAQFSAKRRH